MAIALLLALGSGGLLLLSRGEAVSKSNFGTAGAPQGAAAPTPAPGPVATTSASRRDVGDGDEEGENRPSGMESGLPKGASKPEGVAQRPRQQRKQKIVEAKAAPVRSEPVVEMPPPPPEPAPALPVPRSKTGVIAEIEACGDKVFVAKTLCEDRARWRHCQGRWGKAPECPKPSDPSEGGG